MNRVFILSVFIISFISGFAQEQQEVPFNGLVKFLNGDPVKGARVWVAKGLEAKTDKQGKFGLTNVLPNDTINIKYRKTVYRVAVDNKKSISIVLGDEFSGEITTAYDSPELADYGFGYVKRRESVISSSGISGEVLRRSGQNTILQALAGRVAGLSINGDQVSIRGISSINSGTTPLFILDGSEVSTLDNISLYDVESVEVLKDGSMYGVKGANGVIIVRTIKAH